MTVDIDFGGDDLIPTMTQDADSGEVLMLACVSPKVLDRTVETGRAHHYSRGRGELQEKGASSGHMQRVREVRADYDTDTLLHLVGQNVGARHTGHRSCFYRTVGSGHVGERVFDPDAVYDNE